MTILSTDVQFLISAPMASSGYSKPGVPGNSLGLYCSTTQLSATVLDNLFQDLTGAENAAEQVDYQCVFVFNDNATDTMLSPVVWLPTQALSGPSTFAIGADPTAVSAYAASAAQAVAIRVPTLAPAGVTWTAPSSSVDGGVALPNIAAKSVQAVWIQRTGTGTAGLSAFDIDVTFDTI